MSSPPAAVPSAAAPTAADNLRGIVAISLGVLAFALNDTCTKIVAGHISAYQIMAVRGIPALLLVTAIAAATGTLRVRALANPILIARSLVDAVIALLFITALAHLPLAEITVLLQATPLVLTALSAVWLGEAVGWRRWTAVLVGFLGVVIVVRPTFEGVNAWAMLALAAAALVAVRDVLSRRLPPDVPSWTANIGTTGAVLLTGWSGLALQLEPLRPMDASDLGLLALAAGFIVAANQLLIVAFRNVEVSVVSPFRYLVVVWAMGIGWLVWGDVMDRLDLLGTAILVGAGLYTLHREALRRHS